MSNCQVEEEIFNEQNQVQTLYKEQVSLYLNEFKINASKDKIAIIEEITAAIDLNSLKKYDLKTTEKLLIADLKTLTGFENATKTKVIFYLNKNLIVRSNIIVFNDQNNFNRHNNLILSILNQNENKEMYSGVVSTLNVYAKLKFYNQYENGILKINNIVYLKNKNKKTTRLNADCDYYYLVTTYPSGHQTWQFLYTDCDSNPCTGGGGE